MHISMPSQSQPLSSVTTDNDVSRVNAAAALTVPAPVDWNTDAVALSQLAQVWLAKARILRSQEIDPAAPGNPTTSLSAESIRFLAHCGVTVNGRPVEEFINGTNNTLTPLELQLLAQEMRERAKLMQAESASASPSPMVSATAVTSSVQRSFV
jgi:hypothetical protein